MTIIFVCDLYVNLAQILARHQHLFLETTI